ncbi:Ig-like domain-containing protein [Nocardioides sp. P86]|uniref:Ig-like domain-containing protein n=1 Tax=Nocardioides sp. P86 TaxID=2939569 RepID=UPI00203DEDCC|nr:Ig-like domain-containing protein [Nocardioides sp. P86]MCM3514991.1 Ig-like domain repeat protein [Nocardioides sp. P86]
MKMLTTSLVAAATLAATAMLAPGTTATASSLGVAPRVAGTGGAMVQGAVVDQRGRHVDDVEVRAVDLTTGDVVASDLSYASPDNDIEHGYFALRVRSGSYEVTFSKPGYDTETVVVDRARREKAGIGEVELTKRPVASDTDARAPRRVELGDKVRVSVRVSAAGDPATPSGSVVLTAGRRVVERGQLRDNGTVVLDLGRLGRGDYTFVASYAGNDLLKGSSSARVPVEVYKPRRRH